MPRPQSTIPQLDKRDGVYVVKWYDASDRRTRRLSLRTRDDAVAQARYAEALRTGTDLFKTTEADRGISVSKALDDYWTEHVVPKVRDKTRQENAIRHLKAFFGAEPLSSVDIPACRRYAEARRAGDIGGGRRKATRELMQGSDSTIRRELVTLTAAANHARRWKRISVDDMPTFELPTEGRSTRDEGAEAPWLTKAELSAVLEEAEGDLRDFIILAYWTGSRRNAIERLRVEQVMLRTNRLNLSEPGEKTTTKRRPIVPIYEPMRPVLERRVKEAKEGGWLFSEKADFYRPFREVCERAGLPEGKRNPHVLRHSRVTHMLMDNVSIYKVARLIGDTVQTVEKVYGHHSVEYLEEGNGA